MNCNRCKRKVTVNRKTCIYCGERLDGQPQSKKTTLLNGDGLFVQSEKGEILDTFDFSENIRAKAENVLRRKQNEVTVQNEDRIIEYSSDGTVDKQSVISIDKALTLLARIKD